MARTARELFDASFMRRLEQVRLRAGALGPRRSAEGYHGRVLGDGLEFADHRAYAPGDDVRFVDWAYYARMDRLLLRMFHTHSESDVGLLLDVSASMGADTGQGFDLARQAAAALAWVAVGGGRTVRLITLGERVAPSYTCWRDPARLSDLLEHLAGLQAQGRWRPAQQRKAMHEALAGTGTCVLISDMLECNLSWPGLFETIAAEKDLILVHIQHPAADQLPSGPARLIDAETGQVLDVHVDDELQGHLARCRRQADHDLAAAVQARGGVYAPAPVGQGVDELIFRTLRERHVLTD